MIEMIQSASLPCPTLSVFTRIVTLGWYDGITSGLAESAINGSAYRFDLLAWGPYQERRIFALSALPDSAFDEAVRLLELLGTPVWPRWSPGWPSAQEDGKRLSRTLDEILEESERPKLAIETDSMFKAVFAARHLDQVPAGMIPERFDAYPQSDTYDLWHRFLAEGD